ncbi:hypothetical protein SLA2020_265940 [Shorea laevis]
MEDQDLPKIQLVSQSAHLLDFLYHMIVPKMEELQPLEMVELDVNGKEEYSTSYVDEIWKLLSKLNRGPIRVIKQVIISRAVNFILKFPLTILLPFPFRIHNLKATHGVFILLPR